VKQKRITVDHAEVVTDKNDVEFLRIYRDDGKKQALYDYAQLWESLKVPGAIADFTWDDDWNVTDIKLVLPQDKPPPDAPQSKSEPSKPSSKGMTKEDWAAKDEAQKESIEFQTFVKAGTEIITAAVKCGVDPSALEAPYKHVCYMTAMAIQAGLATRVTYSPKEDK